MTQHQAALKLGVDKSWIAALETTRRALPHEWLFLLGDLYGVSPRWISIGDGQPPVFVLREEDPK